VRRVTFLLEIFFLVAAVNTIHAFDGPGEIQPSLKYPFHLSSALDRFQFRPSRAGTTGTVVSLANNSNARKSAPLAAAFSFLIPGTGQLYADKGKESLIKGISFLAVEATSWILYFNYHSRGKSKERQFEGYADQNWNVDKYLSFLETSLKLSPGELGRKAANTIDYNGLINAEDQWGVISGVSVHHLYANGQQQYYEEIYKYPEQFALGWSDAVDPMLYPQTGYTHNSLTPTMMAYRAMRNDSNRLLGNARAMTGVMLINRVLSLGDAVWTVKRKNKESQQLKMGVRVEPQSFRQQLMMLPTLRITY
jgi:hypothetical protein